MCGRLARDFGQDEPAIQKIEWAGLVHDVGKIGTPDSILLKSGKLTEQEFEIMRAHPVQSAAIIRPLAHLYGGEETVGAVYHHHERIDGQGYPDGIAGEGIPLCSRIISVCDTFDALSSEGKA